MIWCQSWKDLFPWSPWSFDATLQHSESLMLTISILSCKRNQIISAICPQVAGSSLMILDSWHDWLFKNTACKSPHVRLCCTMVRSLDIKRGWYKWANHFMQSIHFQHSEPWPRILGLILVKGCSFDYALFEQDMTMVLVKSWSYPSQRLVTLVTLTSLWLTFD